MGYQAELTTITDGSGEPASVVLKADRLHLVWKTLKAGEKDCGGHLSWCAPISTYEEAGLSMSHSIADLFEQYGFDGEHVELSGGDIHLGWWGGDKIGLSFQTFMRAISVGIDPTEEIRTFWNGEDGDMWAIRHHNQDATSHSVTIGIEL